MAGHRPARPLEPLTETDGDETMMVSQPETLATLSRMGLTWLDQVVPSKVRVSFLNLPCEICWIHSSSGELSASGAEKFQKHTAMFLPSPLPEFNAAPLLLLRPAPQTNTWRCIGQFRMLSGDFFCRLELVSCGIVLAVF